MPAFEYTALTNRGREERGVVEGDNARAVRQLLRERNLTPIAVNETKKGDKSSDKSFSFSFLKAGISSKDLALITRQLSTLTRSGSPLEEALGTVAKQTGKNHVKGVVLDVRSKVLEGHSLANALKEHPRVFPDLYRATVAAGEQSGHLDKILDRLAEYTESRQEMNQKVAMALIYPIILSCVAILIITGLLAYVVPQVVQVFENQNQTLPLLTRFVIASSDIIKNYGIYIFILLVAAGFGFSRFLKTEANRRRYDLFILKIPIIGSLAAGINTARFARTLSILAASGVPILEALRIAAQVVKNLPMSEAINSATSRVREGASIAGSLEKSGLFPPMTVHLIASGESSGKLEEMLERAAHYQERETTMTITAFVNLFEHLMILLMGMVVLVIVIAILQPILNLNQLIK